MPAAISRVTELLLVWALLLPITGCATVGTDYTATRRPDGGVSLHITGAKRYWAPLTAEGPFPSQGLDYAIEVVGPGKDWSYRGKEGFYYGAQDIVCSKKHWDLGYAWMDRQRRYVYLNLYWVRAPNELEPADINGKYETGRKAEEQPN